MMVNGLSVFSAGTALQALGLGLMVGGMLALGAFTAPVLFKSFPRDGAGAAMTIIFRRYDVVLLATLLMIAAGEALRIVSLLSIDLSLTGILRYVLMLVLIAVTLWSTLGVNTTMARMQEQAQTGPAFEALHVQSETLYKCQLVMALALLLWLWPASVQLCLHAPRP